MITWTPGDRLYTSPRCHPRRIIEEIDQPSSVADAAKWPDPFAQHDLDHLITPGELLGLARAAVGAVS
jgi:hypothetical protein